MNRDEYNRRWSGGHARTGQRTIVPDDVQRAVHHAPCFRCGVRGDCQHRSAE